jgi:DNA-binding MarR family transcriptional regulator
VSQASRDEDALVDALFLASRALVGVAARSLAGVEEVTLAQYRALVLIATRPTTTVSDLADALDIHPTSATRLCDRLVRKRLIRRVESAEDRRKTDLHIAAAGRRIVEGVAQSRRADLARIVRRMAPDDVAGATRALAAFAAAADSQAAGADLFGWAPLPQ